MKLGFKLVEVDSGDVERWQIGDGEWTYKTDITNYQRAFLADNIQSGDDKTLLLSFKYIPDGLLIALSRRIKGDRSSERSNETLWIFLPRQIQLLEATIKEIISAGKQVMRDREALRNETNFERFSPAVLIQDYPSAAQPFRSGNMKGTEFAVIDCENLSAAEVIAKGFQKSYANYGYIVLNQSGSADTNDPKISVSSLKEHVWVKLPSSWPENVSTQDLVNIEADGHGIPKGGIYLDTGSHLLTISRQGFLPLKFNVEVRPDMEAFIFTPGVLERARWYKEIDTSNIRLLKENGSRIDSGIVLNSEDAFNRHEQPIPNFRYGDKIYVPEKSLGNFHLSVTGEKYQPVEKTLNLNSLPTDIILEPRKESSTIEGKLRDCRVIVDIQGRGAKDLRKDGIYLLGDKIGKLSDLTSTGSTPTAGSYNAYSGRTEQLEKELAQKKKQNKLLLVSCILWLAGFVIFLCLYLYQSWGEKKAADTNPVPSAQTDTRPVTTTNPAENQIPANPGAANPGSDESAVKAELSLEAAIRYLDQPDSGKGLNVVWEKSEMETFPDLKGLFDAMNNYELEKILNDYYPKLKESKNFEEVAKAIKKNLNFGWNPRQGIHNPKFNSEGDVMINAQNYTYWLDKDQTPKNSQPASPKPGETTKNGNPGNSGNTDKTGNTGKSGGDKSKVF